MSTTAVIPAPPAALAVRVAPASAPADAPEIGSLFAPPAEGPGRYPLGYRLMRSMYHPDDAGARVGESEFHRAAVYACYAYWKPVSRPLFIPAAPPAEGGPRAR